MSEAKTTAERQREWRQRHPEKEKAKKNRHYEANRLLRQAHPDEYAGYLDPDIEGSKRYRHAQRRLRQAHPDEYRDNLEALKGTQ